MVPFDEVSLEIWGAENPGTWVLLPDAEYAEQYAEDDWEEEIAELPVPIGSDDGPLERRALVVGVTIGNRAKAYPVETLRQQSPISDQLGDTPLLLMIAPRRQLHPRLRSPRRRRCSGSLRQAGGRGAGTGRHPNRQRVGFRRAGDHGPARRARAGAGAGDQGLLVRLAGAQSLRSALSGRHAAERCVCSARVERVDRRGRRIRRPRVAAAAILRRFDRLALGCESPLMSRLTAYGASPGDQLGRGM